MKQITIEDFDWDLYSEIAKSIVVIDKENMDKELSDQAYRYSMYHGFLMSAKNLHELAIHALDRYVAITTKTTRVEWNKAGKKLTDKAIEAHVTATDEYNQLHEDVIKYNYKVGLLKGLVAALEQRQNMLVQISSNRRSETKLYN
jgi:hypothetical protein